MALIVNQEPSMVLYNDEKVDLHQMDVDNSTMSNEDENVFRQFSVKAGEYARNIRSKPKFYDWNTKNKSFLDTYDDLYKLGVKNNKFHLVLYDKDLLGVDPYSVVLPKDLQVKIFIECLINPWYWLREILRIPVDGMPIEVGGGVRYKMDRNNLACWYLFLNGIDHYQSKPRQQGKTQDAVAKFNYSYHFGNLSSSALFFNKDQDQANVNLYRLKCQRDMMPQWLQMRMVLTDGGKIDKGIENTKSIRNPVTMNSITTMGKAVSKDSAMKLGRGATAALQYYDEFDFIPYQSEIMKAASFAYSTAARNAKANHSLFGRILTSTPGNLDSNDGAAATEYVSHMLVWKDSMFDTDINKLRKIVEGPSYNRFIFVEHTWKQLKLSMEWYEEQCGLVSFDMETILREIELKRIHGSNLSPFKRSDLMYINSHQKEPIESIDYSKNLCPIDIYEKILLNKVYIMAIDPSEGLSEDNNAMTLIDPVTHVPVAEFKSPYISQPDFCKLLCKFLEDKCPRSMIVIENNRGRELINCFLETRFKYQVYYDDGKTGDKVVESTDPHGRLKAQANQRRAYGVWTGKNRSQYFGILENVMEERKELLCTKYIVKDTCALIRKTNGRIEAADGEHDDNILSYLIGLYVLLFADYEKLEEFGIKRGMSEDIEDYDNSGNITEEATLRKLQEMVPYLPKDMQELIKNTNKQTNPTKEAEEFYTTIQSSKQIQEEFIPENADGNREILHTIYPQDEAYWKQYDRSILDSNNPNQGSSSSFDIDSLID